MLRESTTRWKVARGRESAQGGSIYKIRGITYVRKLPYHCLNRERETPDLLRRSLVSRERNGNRHSGQSDWLSVQSIEHHSNCVTGKLLTNRFSMSLRSCKLLEC